MKTGSVRDLRYDFPKVEAWLKAGKVIQITKRNKVIGRLINEPVAVDEVPKFDLEEHKAWLKKVWGDRVYTKEEREIDRAWETGEP